MQQKPRVFFIQLPLVDPLNTGTEANIPLAGGYLAQSIVTHDVGIPFFLDADIQDFGNDARILSKTVDLQPDIIGFSCFMWNIERTLELARRIKNVMPNVVLCAGGPEITSDSWHNHDSVIDTFVVGSGEFAIVEICRAWNEGICLPPILQVPADIPESSPFVSGLLRSNRSGTGLIETVRGCRSRCRYCYYGKAHKSLQEFSSKSVSDFFDWAKTSLCRNIYIMDPALDQRSNLDDFLACLCELNSSGIPLHTELAAESITSRRADLLQKAGIASVEVGLQTTNPRALATAQRGFHRERFISGVKHLQDAGIEVRTGIILGLPDDSIDAFAETLAFVQALGLAEHAEVYPLSVLPGTGFRSEAESYGLTFQPKPPYIVTSSRGWDENTLYSASELVEGILEKRLFHPILPHHSHFSPEVTSWQNLPDSGVPGVSRSSNFTIHASGASAWDMQLWEAAARIQRDDNPAGTLQLILDADVLPKGSKRNSLARKISNLFYREDHYIERLHVRDDDPQGRFAVRVFLSTSDTGLVRRMMNDGDGFADVIYLPKAEPNEEFLREVMPPILLPPDGISSEGDVLRKGIYKGYEELVIS